MDRRAFDQEMMKIRAMIEQGKHSDYWEGYLRGLKRRFYGESFGTAEEHYRWMTLVDNPDSQKAQQGRGYRDAIQLRFAKP